MDKNELLTNDAGNPRPIKDIAAWEEIAVGRFMPRRIRGSFRGRVLG
jgi:hypothetical protein